MTEEFICRLKTGRPRTGPTPYNTSPEFEPYPDSIYANGMREIAVKTPVRATRVSPFSGDAPSATGVLSAWCLHGFDSAPIGMPFRRGGDGTFETFGAYCSFECAAAHNFDRQRGSHAAYLRHSMLCELAAASRVGTRPASIVPAPGRELLYTFGGPMSIEEFRGSAENYTTVYPLPIVTKDRHIEEIPFSRPESFSLTSKLGPIDDAVSIQPLIGLRRPGSAARKTLIDYLK
jgi:hypothetical protein